MLIGVLNGLGTLFYWTWFIWPFVFVFSLAYGIASFVKNEKASIIPILIAGFSLLIIVCGVTMDLSM